MAGSVETTVKPLPKGPHALSREEVADSQRTRLKSALTELLAEGGYAAVTIGELAKRAGVSRATFYERFAGKEECLLDAYDDFAAGILEAMTAGLDETTPWDEFLAAALGGYLRTLERDPVAARAFIVEMDGAGDAARARRREAMHTFAAVLHQRHGMFRAVDPSLGELPERVYLGLTLGVRELVHERLELEREPRLGELAPDVITWISAMVEGAGAAGARSQLS
ncbi:MAG: TetR/AcrR family transcriptional regulator [Solirubrobacterales bacterium]